MNRRLPLIFVAAITLIGVVVAGVAIAASGVGGSPVAYGVNGTEVSQKTVDHELKWLASNSQVAKAIKQQGGTANDGSIDSKFSANWLTQRIQTELLRQAGARRNVVVPASTRTQLEQQLRKRYPHAPASAIDVLVDGNAYLGALGIDSNAKQSTFFRSALRRAHITVDPRYGRWNPSQGVCAPTGCAPTSAGG
jgi:hypothetical protein